MNYTKLFYWLTVADNAKDLFTVLIGIFTLIAVIATIAYFVYADSDDSNQRMARKWMWWSYPFAILFWMLQIATPSKKDALLIVAGGQTLNFLTTDSTSKHKNMTSAELITKMASDSNFAKIILNK